MLPQHSGDGLTYKPTDPRAADAYAWMGFEARRVLLALLDDAVADPAADVGIVAYDFDLPELVERIIKLKGRVRVIIDNSSGHSGPNHAEDGAEKLLVEAGIPVVRQHMTVLQHNKTMYVDGPTVKRVSLRFDKHELARVLRSVEQRGGGVWAGGGGYRQGRVRDLLEQG